MWCSQTDVINNDGAGKNFAIIDTETPGFKLSIYIVLTRLWYLN